MNKKKPTAHLIDDSFSLLSCGSNMYTMGNVSITCRFFVQLVAFSDALNDEDVYNEHKNLV